MILGHFIRIFHIPHPVNYPQQFIRPFVNNFSSDQIPTEIEEQSFNKRKEQFERKLEEKFAFQIEDVSPTSAPEENPKIPTEKKYKVNVEDEIVIMDVKDRKINEN